MECCRRWLREADVKRLAWGDRASCIGWEKGETDRTQQKGLEKCALFLSPHKPDTDLDRHRRLFLSHKSNAAVAAVGPKSRAHPEPAVTRTSPLDCVIIVRN